MEKNIKKIGFVVHINNNLTAFGSVIEEFYDHGYEVHIFADAVVDRKLEYNPFLHQEHIKKTKFHHLHWYKSYQELAKKINKFDIDSVFLSEALPFALEPKLFKDRKYKAFNLVHNVDNFHIKAIKEKVIDKTIVPYDKYGECFGWNKEDYIALGAPAYDIVGKLSKNKIIEKYNLPQNYILLFLPNNYLLNPHVVYRIIKKIKRAGYKVVIKGKKPKCYRGIYNLFGKCFSNNLSYYPYITHELIYASSGVVGFDTTGIEEILCFEKLYVNFNIKTYRETSFTIRAYRRMWNADFCLDINLLNSPKFRRMIMFAKIPDFMHHFKKPVNFNKLQQELFFKPGGTAERIRFFVEKFL